MCLCVFVSVSKLTAFFIYAIREKETHIDRLSCFDRHIA
jgi:hypothetical protein